MNGDLFWVVFGGIFLVCCFLKYCVNICVVIGGVLYIFDCVSDW